MAHNLLRKHHSKICGILDGSDVSLQSFTVSLYSEGIIDESTKHSVMRNKGITGADELMNAVSKFVVTDPSKYLEMVLDIMEKVKVLENVSQSIRDKICTLITTTGQEEEEMSGSEDSPVVYKKVDKLYTEAVNLRNAFQELLVKLTKSLDKADNDSLKVILNWHLKCERENTPEVNGILTKIDELSSPKKVLNCLIRSDLIGYLNYRLLDVFQGLINDREVDGMITKYEEAHETFLKSTDLETLAQLFLDHPELAPETFAGLPRFTVHLDEKWEKKNSTYQWNQLLKTKFNQWPARIYIVKITKKCIIIEYCILPCDAPGIVRDLSDSQVLSTEGVREVQLSDQLREMGKHNQNTSLFEAVQQGADTATVSTLLKEGANIHTTDEYGNTPLHHAAVNANIATVELLLNEGATIDINKKRRYGYTSLHLAAEHGHDSIIEILLKYGANVDERDMFGYTPLHRAARNGSTTTVELLLKYRADYSIQSKYGETILHSAVEGGNIEILKLFLQLCNLNAVGSLGYTPLHWAVDRGHIEIVDVLIKSGAYMDGMKGSHLTPLHVAADNNHVYIAELLLKAGANVHLKDKVHDGRTPLHHAAKVGHERIVELLLKYEANVNEKDKTNGFTPLQLAVGARGDHECQLLISDSSSVATVKILLSNGANVNEKDHHGHTSIYYARTLSHSYGDLVHQILKLSIEKQRTRSSTSQGTKSSTSQWTSAISQHGTIDSGIMSATSSSGLSYNDELPRVPTIRHGYRYNQQHTLPPLIPPTPMPGITEDTERIESTAVRSELHHDEDEKKSQDKKCCQLM